MKRILIMGASSGIGFQTAVRFIDDGWTVGVAARHENALKELRSIAPDRVFYKLIDVTAADSAESMLMLAHDMGGMDVYFNCSGVGWQNPTLDSDKELATTAVNVDGFTRMVTAAFNYFKNNGGGHIAVVSSVAGTKGLGIAPAYSATKRFQSTYIQALSQLSHISHAGVSFTDIRPGFVRTPMLKNDKSYPMLMDVGRVADGIVRAIKLRRRVAIIDWRYSVLVSLWSLIPRQIWERLLIKNR